MAGWSGWLLLALVAQALGWARTARILGVYPVPSKSHHGVINSLLKELAARGHEVTVISSFPPEKPLANYTHVDVDFDMKKLLGNTNPFNFGKINSFSNLLLIFGMGEVISKHTLENEKVQEIIKSKKYQFDVVILEDFGNEALAGIAHVFNAPLIYFSSAVGFVWTNDFIGNPSCYAYIPSVFSSYSDHMTFTERVHNTLLNLFSELYYHLIFIPKQDSLMRKYLQEIVDLPHLSEINAKTSLVLTNALPGKNYPQPVLPNLIQVGGIHISPPKQLPQDLQAFLDNASEGVIYFSMGSLLKSADFSEHIQESFLKAFGKLKQKVLWKFEVSNFPGQPSNVFIKNWFPQNDILAHPNTKLFITHGGLLSNHEAVYHGVPLLGIPILGDQRLNMRNTERLGYGLILEMSNITDTSVEWALNEALNNPRCREWVQVIGDEDLVHVPIEKLHSSRFVCRDHFRESDFHQPKGKVLKKSSVPTVLNTIPLTVDYLSCFPVHIGGGEEVLLTESIIAPDHAPHSHTLSDVQAEEQLQSSDVPQTHNSGHQTGSRYPSNDCLDLSFISATTAAGYQDLATPLDASSVSHSQHKVDDEDTFAMIKREHATGITSRCTKKGMMHKMGLEGVQITPNKKILVKKLMTSTSKVKSLCKKLKECRNQLKHLTSKNNLELILTAVKNKHLRQILQSNMQNCDRKSEGRRWTLMDKLRALSIYKRSPRTYRYLQTLITLPSVRALQRVLSNIVLKPGIHSQTITHLQKCLLSMPDIDKNCIVMFDEIGLQKRMIYNDSAGFVEGFVDFGPHGRTGEVADHALVFMVQGLATRYKQPVAFYFSKGTTSTHTLQAIIVEVIESLQSAGFHVLATVCDQGATNCSAMENLKKKSLSDAPGSFFEVNGQKIYILFDIPHLFKSLRNNFINNIMLWDKKLARWSNVISLHRLDTRFFRTHRLTNLHVNPTGKAKMNVKIAAQTLSQSTASGLKTVVYCSRLSGSYSAIVGAKETANVIDDLDRLFDACNGPSKKDKKKSRRKNVTAGSGHIEIWGSFKKKLSEMRFFRCDGSEVCRSSHTTDFTNRCRCIQGFVTTLSSMQCLWRHLHDKGLTVLNLRQLNQDPIENLFSTIRQHGAANTNPSCTHFISALKTAIVTKLSSSHSRGANCKSDDGELLYDLRDLICSNESSAMKSEESVILPSTSELDNTDQNLFHISEEIPNDADCETENRLCNIESQSQYYVAGYVAKKLKNVVNCFACTTSFTVSEPCPGHTFTIEKQWREGSLLLASEELVETVISAYNIFATSVVEGGLLHDMNVKLLTKTILMTCDTQWIKCLDHKELVIDLLFNTLTRLFINTECKRRNQVIKEANQHIVNAKNIQKCKGM